MIKNDNISEFDQLFKQSLESGSSPVPPGVWEGVSSVTSVAGSAGVSSTSLLMKLFGIKGAAVFGGLAVIVTSAVVLVNSFDEVNEKQSQPEIYDSLVLEQLNNNTEETFSNTDGSNNSPRLDDNAQQKRNPRHNLQTSNQVDHKQENANFGGDINKKAAVELSSYNDKRAPGSVEASIKLVPSSTKSCVNQKINFSVQSNLPIAFLTWYINDKLVREGGTYMAFLFDQPIKNKVTIIGETKDGQNFNVSQLIATERANAAFTVTQNEGVFDLQAQRVNKTNAWFVDQVLVKENQQNLRLTPNTNQATIVHISTDLNGCTDTAHQVVLRKPECNIDLKIPNIFSPYFQDGINDEFEIEIPQVEGFRLTVYNLKDGKVVFDTDNQTETWNGRYENVGGLVPVGYYIYRLVYQCDGQTTTKQDRVMVSDAKN